MAQEETPKQPISISQARSRREASPKISDTTIDDLKQALAEVVDAQVSAKIGRLETSINRIMDHIDAVVRGEAEDSALRVTTDSNAADLALSKIELFPEDYYIHTSKDLAEKLEIRLYDVTQIVRKLNLLGDPTYHKTFRLGKSQIPKYSEATYLKLQDALDKGEYPRPPQI